MPKGCGSCTECCTIMGVDMAPHPEPRKPIYTPCRHLCKRGCGIYEIRPLTCRSWECLWLFTQKLEEDLQLPKELRPDRTGVVLEINTHGSVIAHCRTGREWRKEPMYGTLLRFVKRGMKVLVGHHEEYSLLNPDGSPEELVRLGISEKGEVTYARKNELEAKIKMAADKLKDKAA